jgi:hypothetical protein
MPDTLTQSGPFFCFQFLALTLPAAMTPDAGGGGKREHRGSLATHQSRGADPSLARSRLALRAALRAHGRDGHRQGFYRWRSPRHPFLGNCADEQI